MPYEIKLPHVGESVTEAVIDRWLKKPGDRVEKYDPIVEVITDKVNMEVPSPASGTLTRLLAQEGETVPMGAVIAEMETDDEPAAQSSDGAAATADAGDAPGGTASANKSASLFTAPAADRVGTMITGANVGPTGGEFTDTSLSPSAAPAQADAETVIVSVERGRRAYSPVVTRLAAENGLDLATVAGTGLGGRVTKKDVLNALARDGGATATPDASGDRTIRPTAVRRMIADHMSKSVREIPHAWSAVEVDVTGLVECRKANRDAARSVHGVNLTYLPFTVREVALALRKNPLLNSTWDDGKIVLRGQVNVAVAVATENGLVAPVARAADTRGVIDLAGEVGRLVDAARAGRLTLEDVQGGTFTLNNTGALGSVWGGAIINHPQAAILTTEAIVRRPVVTGHGTDETIAVRSVMNICLSFDHRVIDGAEAAKFLQDVKAGLEAITEGTVLS